MTAWLTQTLVATMLLMAIVLMLRAPTARAFGPRAAYALWLLPALRMILPPLPGWATLFGPIGTIPAAEGLLGPAEAAVAAPPPLDPGAIAQTASLPASLPVPETASLFAAIEPMHMLLALWLGIAALYFAWQMLRYHLFLRQALHGAVPLTIECGVEVLVSPGVAGPVAIGILRRRILLPADFLARYTPEERHLALLHEAAHHDRLDILANLAALAVRALHWWNPLAYRAYSAFRADQELACDATVLAEAAPEQRIVYGRALLKSASAHMPAMACALNPKSQLKARIGMIGKPIGRARLLFGAALALTLIGAGMMATASGFALPPAAPVESVAPLPPAPMPQPAPHSEAHPHAAVPHAPKPAAAPILASSAVPAAPLPPAPLPAPKAPPAPAPLADSAEPAPCPEEQQSAREAAVEARRAARDAQREAEHARREAEREAAAAQREAAAAQREALAEARAVQSRVPAMVQASLASTRRGMVEACERQGVTLPAGADWGEVATCGPKLRQTIRASLAGVRASLARNLALTGERRVDALSGLDDAIAGLDDAGHDR